MSASHSCSGYAQALSVEDAERLNSILMHMTGKCREFRILNASPFETRRQPGVIKQLRPKALRVVCGAYLVQDFGRSETCNLLLQLEHSRYAKGRVAIAGE